MSETTRARQVFFFPYVFGLVHLLVDAATISTIDTSYIAHELPPYWAFYYVVAYDLLAFASQPLLGFLVDRTRFFRGAILAGLGAVLAGVLLKSVEPLSTLVLAGVGNALFHLGAGAFALHVEPGRATPPGIFVGPGAIGVVLAKFLVKSDLVYLWPFVLALAAAFVVSWIYRYPEIPRTEYLDHPGYVQYLAIAFGFGFAGFAGKALGGVLSDRLGWIKVGVATLLISAPLIAFGGSNYVLVTIGVFLVQMTMPVTLVALFALLPGRPAFAFGLSCLAYIAGAIPTFYHQVRAFYGPFAFLALMLLSAITLYAGLRMLREKVPMRFPSYNSQPPAARPFGGERN